MPSSPELRQRSVRGGLHNLLGQVSSLVLRTGSMILLARLLTPDDFGLIGMVTVVTGFISLFRDGGLSLAAIQRAELLPAQQSMLFWINAALGLLLGAIVALSAPVLVVFFQDPRLFPITLALALVFPLNGVCVQHDAWLRRSMRFGALVLVENLSLVGGIAMAWAGALTGWGYWSLVAMTLGSAGLRTVFMWLASGWRPGRFVWDSSMGSTLRLGGALSFNALVVYVAYNLEKVLLGRFFGPEVLGIYGRAYQLIRLPADQLNGVVGDVAYPALSRLQSDPVRFRSYFLGAYEVFLLLALPVTVVGAVLGREVIHCVLGPKWSAAGVIFQLLSPTVLALALMNPGAWILMSLGNVARSVRIAVMIAVVTITAYLLAIRHGPTGVAAACSLTMLLLIWPSLAWTVHGSPVSMRDLWGVMSFPIVAGAMAGGVGALVAHLGLPSASPWWRLAAGGAAILACYAAALSLSSRHRRLIVAGWRDLVRRPAEGTA